MGFSFNESLFIIDCDDDSESILSIGEQLADGIEIGEDTDRGEEFNFYLSEDGRFNILAVAPIVAERWVKEGYLPNRALQKHFSKDESGLDILDCYLIISPSSHVLTRLTDARAHGSAYYAHMVASSIWHSRQVDPFINLRDGILCELFGVVLPTYTKAPQVADLALFANTLRGQYDEEDLRSNADFTDGKGGLNRISFNECLARFNYPVDKIEPFLQLGESVDDFIKVKDGALVTGSLELTQEYQLYALNSDTVLLVMTKDWAQQLIDRNLLLKMNTSSIQVGGQMLQVLALSRRYAVESLNNRHYGINQDNAFALALSMSRSLYNFANTSLKNALYIQKLGIILPIKFDTLTPNEAREEAREILSDVVSCGPFALGPFLDDVHDSCLKILK